MNLFGKKQLPDNIFYDFHIGDNVKFIGINYFWQLFYYLFLDTETTYKINDIIYSTYYISLKFDEFDDIFFYDSFRSATLKEIRKEKLNILKNG